MTANKQTEHNGDRQNVTSEDVWQVNKYMDKDKRDEGPF